MPDPIYEIVDVTPALAKQWLGANTHNRNPRPFKVAAYARDMRAGAWAVGAGEPISFSIDGVLLNGQNRLLAVIAAGVTVRLTVARNVNPEAQDKMDNCAVRTGGDALALLGHKNTRWLAAAARLALRVEHHIDQPTIHEIEQYVDDNPGLTTAVNFASSMVRKHTDVPPAPASVAFMWFADVDPDAAQEFWGGIIQARTDGPGDPRYALINRLRTARAHGATLTPEQHLWILVRAWNAWRSGERLARIQLPSDVLPLPRIQ